MSTYIDDLRDNFFGPYIGPNNEIERTTVILTLIEDLAMGRFNDDLAENEYAASDIVAFAAEVLNHKIGK